VVCRRKFVKASCDSSCTCKLDIYFVSVKYVLVSVKLVCVYVKLLKSKRGIFVITEKPRVIFAKCIWIRGNFKINEGWFCKHTFSYFIPCKNYIFVQKFHLKCMC
jgi:hypothetical protein